MRQVDRAFGRLRRSTARGCARVSGRARELLGGDQLTGRRPDRDRCHHWPGRFREEVVALVVDDDEGREVLDLDTPYRFHAELGVLEHVDVTDAVLSQAGRRTADA